MARYKAGDLAWYPQRPLTAQSANGAVLKIYNDEPVDFTNYDGSNLTTSRGPGNGLVVASGPNPDTETYTVTFRPGAGVWKALEIQVVQDESLPGIRVARGADRLVISEVEAEAAGEPHALLPGHRQCQREPTRRPSIAPPAAIDGDPKTGWAMATYNDVTKAALALRFAEPLRTAADTVVTVRLRQDSEFRRATIGRFRVALSPAEDSWPAGEARKEIPDAVLKALAQAEADKRTDAERKAHRRRTSNGRRPKRRRTSQPSRSWNCEAARLDASIDRTSWSPRPPTPPKPASWPRGNWMDETGEMVHSGHPGLPRQARYRRPPRHAARPGQLAGLATQSAHRARVRQSHVAPVLRHRHFQDRSTISARRANGRRIPNCSTGWPPNSCTPSGRPKARTPGTCATWCAPSCSARPTGSRRCRGPTWTSAIPTTACWRARAASAWMPKSSATSRFRSPACWSRSSAAPASSPISPTATWRALNFPKREYSASHGDDLYRRGVYTFWQRTFLHPSLLTFDAPTREECTINRINSNTPLQALVLLNDPIYVEAARVFAQNLLRAERTLDARIDWAFERAVEPPRHRRRAPHPARSVPQEPGRVPPARRPQPKR